MALHQNRSRGAAPAQTPESCRKEHRDDRSIASNGVERVRSKLVQTFFRLALVAVSGCSASSDSPTTDHAPVSEQEILNEFGVAGQQVQFIQLGESGSERQLLLVHSVVKAKERELVGRLIASNGPLTLLEIFQALAPDDLAPHPTLVQSHAEEATALGRADVNAVLELPTDMRRDQHGGHRLLATLPPGSLETCEEALFPDDEPGVVWTQVRSTPHTGGPPAPPEADFFCAGIGAGIWFPPGDDICRVSFFTEMLRVGLCHVSPESPASSYQFAASFTGEPMAYLNPRVLNFGQLDFFTAAATSTPKRVAVVNFPGAGNYAYVMGGAVGAIP